MTKDNEAEITYWPEEENDGRHGLIQELAEAVQDTIIPIYERHGLHDPHFFVEESVSGKSDGKVVVYVDSNPYDEDEDEKPEAQ